MMNPTLTLMVQKSMQNDLMREAARSTAAAAGSRRRPRSLTRTPDRGRLLAGARDLIRLAASAGYGRDDVIRIIESLP